MPRTEVSSLSSAIAITLLLALLAPGCTKSEAERDRYAQDAARRSLEQIDGRRSAAPETSSISGDPDAPKPADGARYAALNVPLTHENATRVLADADSYLTERQHRLLDGYKSRNTAYGELYWAKGDSVQALLDKEADFEKLAADAHAFLAEKARKDAVSKLSSAPEYRDYDYLAGNSPDGLTGRWDKFKVIAVRDDLDPSEPYREQLFIATGKSLCSGLALQKLLRRPEGTASFVSRLPGKTLILFRGEAGGVDYNMYSDTDMISASMNAKLPCGKAQSMHRIK